jgi:hypothetical protein
MLIKILASFLVENIKLTLKFIWQCKGPRTKKDIGMKEQTGRMNTTMIQGIINL